MLDLNTYVLNEMIQSRQEEIRRMANQDRLYRSLKAASIRDGKRITLRRRIGLGMISLGEQLAQVQAG